MLPALQFKEAKKPSQNTCVVHYFKNCQLHCRTWKLLLEALTCHWSFTFHKPFQPTRLVRTKRQNVHDRGDNLIQNAVQCAALTAKNRK